MLFFKYTWKEPQKHLNERGEQITQAFKWDLGLFLWKRPNSKYESVTSCDSVQPYCNAPFFVGLSDSSLLFQMKFSMSCTVPTLLTDKQ